MYIILKYWVKIQDILLFCIIYIYNMYIILKYWVKIQDHIIIL